MLLFLYHLTIFLLLLSSLAYILIIIKEKIFMKKDIIIIENKHLTKKDFDEIDTNEFILKGKRVKCGDEVKVITFKKETINGILLGSNKNKKAIHIITNKNKVKKLEVDTIFKFRRISKYGKFLNY